MKHITFKKKLIAILSAMVLAVSCPIIAMAEDDYSSASTIKTEASKEKIVDKETVSECNDFFRLGRASKSGGSRA